MADPNDNLIVPIFKTHSMHNEAESRVKGRPVFDDIEIVEIRIAADRQRVGVFPAHEVWKWTDNIDGSREPTTYAMRWPDQYRRFKSSEAQVQSGTPLSELTFLTQAKRMELKALNIHTAETLAALDGGPLKQLGPGGREMKNQAQAYLEKSSDSAVETRLAAENNDLRQQLLDMQKQINAINASAASRRPNAPAAEPDDEPDDEPEPDIDADADAENDANGADPDEDQADAGDPGASPFETWTDEDIKLWLKDQSGNLPKGNPGHKTLVRMADELNAELAAKAQGN